MKVSKLFHWLYASVMFIPIFIIPILGLAIRSDNNFQPIEIQVGEQVQKINYKYQSNEVNTLDDLVEGNIYYINGTTNFYDLGFYYYIEILKTTKYECNETPSYDSYIITDNYDILHDNYIKDINYPDGHGEILLSNKNGYAQLYISNNDIYVDDIIFIYNSSLYQYFNNESYLPQYTDYNIIDSVTTEGELVTYNDTDVGSQMVYTLYNATDKYFNFNQFLGIGNLYNWFNINVFNGNAPLGFTILWNLLTYWLLVSIAWLIFDIAMFVPKLAHRWLDKASLE